MIQNKTIFRTNYIFLRKSQRDIQSDVRKMSDIRLKEIAFSDIQSDTGYSMLLSVRISDIRYPVIL